MRNTRRPVRRNDTTGTITETASSTNRPPMIASTISCLVATATAPSSPPSASEPVSPMKIEAGGAVDHKETAAAAAPPPARRAAQHRELAGTGHEMDLQIIGEHRVADQVGDHAEAAGRHHHRHDGEPVEAIGEVHCVAGADDDEGAEGDEEPAQVDDQLLEEREGQRGRERHAPEM